jgi:hypothetical protein
LSSEPPTVCQSLLLFIEDYLGTPFSAEGFEANQTEEKTTTRGKTPLGVSQRQVQRDLRPKASKSKPKRLARSNGKQDSFITTPSLKPSEASYSPES